VTLPASGTEYSTLTIPGERAQAFPVCESSCKRSFGEDDHSLASKSQGMTLDFVVTF